MTLNIDSGGSVQENTAFLRLFSILLFVFVWKCQQGPLLCDGKRMGGRQAYRPRHCGFAFTTGDGRSRCYWPLLRLGLHGKYDGQTFPTTSINMAFQELHRGRDLEGKQADSMCGLIC